MLKTEKKQYSHKIGCINATTYQGDLQIYNSLVPNTLKYYDL